MRVSRNARTAGERIDRHFAKQKRIVVDTILIGQDPVMYGVHYAIVARDAIPTKRDCFSMHHLVEWSMHPNPEDAKNMPYSSGTYDMTYGEALNAASDLKRRKLEGTWWVIPGTDRPVPGSGITRY